MVVPTENRAIYQPFGDVSAFGQTHALDGAGLLGKPRPGDAQPGTRSLEEGQITPGGLRICGPDGLAEEQEGLSTTEALTLLPGSKIAATEVASVAASVTIFHSIPVAEDRRPAAT